MSIIIFVIVVAVLILVHELGHFLVAKRSGVRVDEFGIGFPPKILHLFKWRGTNFTLNAIPFGGFVKIFGENPSEEELSPEDKKTSFSYKPKSVQAMILAGGVIFNLLFAWLLIAFGFVIGLPTDVSSTQRIVQNPELTIVQVLESSPAGMAGLKAGDVILSLGESEFLIENPTIEQVSDFVVASESAVDVAVRRGEETLAFEVEPQEGIKEEGKAIGISMGMIGTLRLPPYVALWEGAKTTAFLTQAITVGLATFIVDTFTGQADFSQIAGPVGIVGLVGDASRLGFIFLLQFTAFISINLAVINLAPFPALDGGRLLFTFIEALKGSPISPRIVNSLNLFGFALLILLMVLVTVNDIVRLF
jgi:regulator of sigma E protease